MVARRVVAAVHILKGGMKTYMSHRDGPVITRSNLLWIDPLKRRHPTSSAKNPPNLADKHTEVLNGWRPNLFCETSDKIRDYPRRLYTHKPVKTKITRPDCKHRSCWTLKTEQKSQASGNPPKRFPAVRGSCQASAALFANLLGSHYWSDQRSGRTAWKSL